MKVEKDFEELLELFNKNKVRYCIVGAYAVGFHVRPRYTKDMDILVEPNVNNAERVIKSLNKFGFGSLKLNKKDFSQKHKVVQLGYEPVRIDIITSIGGCGFKEVWKSRVSGTYGKEKVFFIGIEELIKNKKSSKRKQDKTDVDLLLLARNRYKK